MALPGGWSIEGFAKVQETAGGGPALTALFGTRDALLQWLEKNPMAKAFGRKGELVAKLPAPPPPAEEDPLAGLFAPAMANAPAVVKERPQLQTFAPPKVGDSLVIAEVREPQKDKSGKLYCTVRIDTPAGRSAYFSYYIQGFGARK